MSNANSVANLSSEVSTTNHGVEEQDHMLSRTFEARPYFDEGVPGPSSATSADIASTPDHVNVLRPKDFISPENIQPYPKAEARKQLGKKRGKSCGRTKIATDTPEKEELRMKKEKKESKKQTKRAKANMKKETNKKVRHVKKLTFPSDSEDDDLDINLFSEEEDNITEMLEVINQETSELQDQMNFERETFEDGDYVLVNFQKKSGMPEQYVGKIISVSGDKIEYKIQFYKRIGNGNKFMKESEDVYDVDGEDILVKLPNPEVLSGSARVTGQLWFQVDFINYNIK